MRAQAGKPVIELVEEAVHLLRKTPLAYLAYYFIGSVPFVLGLLFFVADMSRSPFAQQRCAPAAMALALLYAWMRYWHTVFCSALHQQVADLPGLSWSPALTVRNATTQFTHSAFSFVLVPLSLLALFPYAWVYAYHQNLVAVCQHGPSSHAEVSRAARVYAADEARQNHLLISLLGLFRVVIWLNIVIMMVILPGLLKSVIGLESRFAQSYWWIANTTFLTATMGITYLCVDPLVKAIYVLRCFYSAAKQSGEDLAADLRQAARKRGLGAGFVIIMGCLLTLSSPRVAANPEPKEQVIYAQPASESITADHQLATAELDGKLDRLMTRREYTWRMRRDLLPVQEEKHSIFIRFADSIAGLIKAFMRSFTNGVESLLDWLWKKLFESEVEDGQVRGTGQAWISALRWVSWLLIGLLVVLLGILGWRTWKHRKVVEVSAEEAPVVPDLEDEDVLASQLPEEEWLALAARLRESGAYRKAMRAYFLSALASLGRVHLVEILRAKSNREYQQELARAGFRHPGVNDTFNSAVTAFERVWYGVHSLTDTDVAGYAQAIDQLRQQLER